MIDTYVAFDVETPNSRNDRMSAIGITVVDHGAVTEEFFSYVNPEEPFDAFNIQLTGITPRMVRNQPTFPVLWELLRPLLDRGILCAHNAIFDLGVLGKCLRDYGIPWKSAVKYCCTVQMARRRFARETYGSYRLDTLCAAFDIPLENHHDALCDAMACYRLYRELLCDFGPDPRDVRPYRKRAKPMEKPAGRFSTESVTDLELRKLRELLLDVHPETFLNPGDSMAIAHWMDRHVELSSEPPFDAIFQYLYRMISDKPLTCAEAQEFFRLLGQ